MVDQKQEIWRIPTRRVSSEEVRVKLSAKIADSENQYKLPSEQMLDLLTNGEIEETEEILEWMQAYHALRWRMERGTLTAGTPTTTIEPSMKAV